MDARRLKDLAINESGLIFEPSTGYVFSSNPTGILIINALKEGRDINEIKHTIAGVYDVEDNTVEKDIFDFLGQLATYGLIGKTA